MKEYRGKELKRDKSPTGVAVYFDWLFTKTQKLIWKNGGEKSLRRVKSPPDIAVYLVLLITTTTKTKRGKNGGVDKSPSGVAVNSVRAAAYPHQRSTQIVFCFFVIILVHMMSALFGERKIG